MKTFLFLFLSILTFIASGQSKTDAEKIVGNWVCNDVGYPMELNLKSDGTGVVDGDVVTWALKPGLLIVSFEGEKETYNYVFAEAGLRVSGGNLEIPLNFKRTKTGNVPASPNANTTTTSSGKKLDQSLVGKWCYLNVTSGRSSEQCIIVNADGTYEYYAERSTSGSSGSTASQSGDSGTWWVEGNRVHYNSQNKGEDYYILVKQNHPKTGDPMIVLDGTAYVTFFKKSPWQL
jgi:hypothetical protein